MTAAKISLQEGKNEAISFALGASVIIFFHTFIAVLFARFISNHQEIVSTLQEIGIFIFSLLSIYFFWIAKKPKKIKTDEMATPGAKNKLLEPKEVNKKLDIKYASAASRAVNTRIAETTFTTAGPAAIVLDGNTIRTNSQGGRCDLHLYVNGTRVDQTLDYNDGNGGNWQDAVVGYMGTVSAGTHTVWYQSANCAGWGCGSDWGHLQVLIFE